MYYLIHLALPAIAALMMAVSAAPIELSLSGLSDTTENLAELYMLFAAPHWIWAAVSGYLDTSKGATVGGFVGLHLLLSLVWFLVTRSNESHAADGWFIYFLGAPIGIAVGVIAGRSVASWKTRQSALLTRTPEGRHAGKPAARP